MSVLLIASVAIGFAQDTPQDIPKAEWPKSAECVVCSAKGAGHAEEKPAAAISYKGKAFYFCNAGETTEFKRNPDLYIPLELPMTLPPFDLTDTSGHLWDADAFKGKLVLIDYWATWCKPCLALKPKLDKIRATYGERGFEVLSVSIDEKRQTVNTFLGKNPFANPVAFDDKQTWARLKVVAIPALFLVKDGQVVASFKGPKDTKEIEEAVKANL